MRFKSDRQRKAVMSKYKTFVTGSVVNYERNPQTQMREAKLNPVVIEVDGQEAGKRYIETLNPGARARYKVITIKKGHEKEVLSKVI